MSNAIKYQSLSEEGKVIVRQFIEDGKEYGRKELVAAIRERAERKDEMTDGVIAGVIKMLTASQEIIAVARGRYKKGYPMNSNNIQDKVLSLFYKFKGDLDKLCMVNALNLKTGDIEFIGKLKDVCNNLEAFIWELEDIEGEKREQEKREQEKQEQEKQATDKQAEDKKAEGKRAEEKQVQEKQVKEKKAQEKQGERKEEKQEEKRVEPVQKEVVTVKKESENPAKEKAPEKKEKK